MKNNKGVPTNFKRKYRLAILSAFIIFMLLSGLASAKPVGQTNGLSKENILWMQSPYDLLDKLNVNTALQQITDGKYTSIAVFRAAWDHAGNALPMDGIADSVYQQFLSTVKGFNSNLKVYVCNYGGAWTNDNGVVETPDVGKTDVRSTMANAVTQELGIVSSDGYSFDGYIDDTEVWIGSDGDI